MFRDWLNVGPSWRTDLCAWISVKVDFGSGPFETDASHRHGGWFAWRHRAVTARGRAASGLDGERAFRAIVVSAAMSGVVVILLFPFSDGVVEAVTSP
jgi:hypothetical protein